MREIEKKAAKSIKDKILGWMKGSQPETEIVQRPTAVGKQYDSVVRERSAKYQTPSGKTGTNEPYFGGYSPEQAEAGWHGVTDPNNSRKVFKTSKDNTPSADMGRRLKKESDDFYNSDAGKNSPNKIPEGWGWDNNVGDLVRKKPPTKPSSSSGTMDGNQMGKFIKDYAADPANVTGKRDINNYVTKEDGFADFKKNINKNFVTKKNGMSATEKAAVGMGAGAVAGEAINDAMDLNQAMNRRDAEIKKNQSQQDAHGYWTRKKSGN